MLRRSLRIISIVLAAIMALVIILVASGAGLLRGSLPVLDGKKPVPGLSGRVEITRDSAGVPYIKALDRIDAARALGYIHAQDRFFQMDLQRRRAAGTLAELLGPQLLGSDRETRIHRFSDLARRVVKQAPPRYRAILDAYTEGVNVGLDDLRVRPFEYLVLRQKPRPWRPEDTILTLYSMFLDLSLSTASTELASSMVADILPKPLADYLLTPAARWDAPLQEGPPYPAPMPDSAQVDMRKWKTAASDAIGEADVAVSRVEDGCGSNNWAVAGALTAHGGALLANDMHLGLSLPNIWYRARIELEGDGQHRSMVGVTLPGTPAIVAGSNGMVAWGFTNSYVDCADLVRLEIDPEDSTRYMTPEGWESFGMVPEVINVAGKDPDTLWIKETRWGPVWASDASGAPLALSWTAHDTGAVDLGLLGVESARTVDDAVLAAAGAGIPPQNFVCADSAGDIAWTIAGRIPRRAGWDGRLPVSWADGSCRWDGYMAPEDQPKIIRPAEGRLWTANNRVAGGYFYSVLGDGGYGLGARARQIRDDLRQLEMPDEKDMLAVQLDDRALFVDEWRMFVLGELKGDTTRSRREFARILREDWSGRASVESAGYRLAETFVERLVNIVYRSLTGPVWSKRADFRSYWLSYRHSITWELVHRKPPHLLLPLYHDDWRSVVTQAVDETMEYATRGGKPAAEWRWGDYNIINISHPFARLIPRLGQWLSAPRIGLPGDSNMPRVQHPRHGASERLVVSPGHEMAGIFEMPGGESGHPLSPYFLAGHEDWVKGRPSSLLPGPPVHTLVLKPVK